MIKRLNLTKFYQGCVLCQGRKPIKSRAQFKQIDSIIIDFRGSRTKTGLYTRRKIFSNLTKFTKIRILLKVSGLMRLVSPNVNRLTEMRKREQSGRKRMGVHVSTRRLKNFIKFNHGSVSHQVKFSKLQFKQIAVKRECIDIMKLPA